MKSFNPADAQSASTHYAPSVPMTVYRELAAELRANQAVIDSLKSRNQKLLEQNQRLKQEIHNVVQATLSLGQVAGVARQALQGENLQELTKDFLGAVAPDTLARLVRGGEAAPADQHVLAALLEQPVPLEANHPQAPQSSSAAPATPLHNRVLRPIAQQPAKQPAKQPPANAAVQATAKKTAKGNTTGTVRNRDAKRQQAQKQPRQLPFRQTEAIPSKGSMIQLPHKKLFTEQSGEYRSSVLDTSENKEIGGIWLVLSIILIIVTAFGAGFLIMKPLLNDR